MHEFVKKKVPFFSDKKTLTLHTSIGYLWQRLLSLTVALWTFLHLSKESAALRVTFSGDGLQNRMQQKKAKQFSLRFLCHTRH